MRITLSLFIVVLGFITHDAVAQPGHPLNQFRMEESRTVGAKASDINYIPLYITNNSKEPVIIEIISDHSGQIFSFEYPPYGDGKTYFACGEGHLDCQRVQAVYVRDTKHREQLCVSSYANISGAKKVVTTLSADGKTCSMEGLGSADIR